MKIDELVVNPEYEQLVFPLSEVDFNNLEQSILKEGVIYPIIINPQKTILDGHHRVKICKKHGISNIEKLIREFNDELDEKEFVISCNLNRRHILNAQKAELGLIIAEIEVERAKRRQGIRTDLNINDKEVANFPQLFGECYEKRENGYEYGEALEIAAKKVGLSDETLRRVKIIKDNAKKDNKIADAWEIAKKDKTTSINSIWRTIKQKKDEERILNTTLMKIEKGIFKTILIDPPWDYEGLSLAGRGKPEYSVLSMEELKDFDLLQYADKEGCHLYLWTTNNFLYEALKLGHHWGFSYKTILTWVKPHFGLGSYFRNNTEHCLFFVYGLLPTRKDDIPTSFEAPRTQHSEKPERIYEIIEAASYPPYLEIFGRKERKGWEILKGDIRN